MPYLDFEDREVDQKGSINDERESNVTLENVEIEEIDDEIDEDEIDYANTKLDLGKNAIDFSDIQKKANELKKTTTANVAPTKKAEVDNKTINEINNINPFNLDDLDDDDDEEEIEEEQEERITEFDVQNRVAEIGRQKSQETKTVERPTINFNADEMNEELEQDERDYEEELQQQELNKGVKKPPRQIKEVDGFQVYDIEDVGEALESYEKDNDFHVVEMADVEKQKDVEPNIYDDSKILESEEFKEIKKAIYGDMDFIAEKNRPLDFSSNGSGDQEVQEEGPSTLGKVAGFVGKAALLPFKGIGYFADKVGDSEFLYNEDLHPLVGFGLALLEGLFDCGYALFSAIGGGLSGLFGAAENKVRENGIDLPEGAAEKEAESVKDCKDTFELAKAKLNEKLELCNKGLVSRDQFLNNKKITDFYKNVYGKELSDYFKEIDEKKEKEKEESKKKEEAEKTKENNNNNNNEAADDKKKEEKVNEAPQVENNNNNPNNDNNTANVTDDKKKEEKDNDEPKVENTESNSNNNNSTDNKKEEKEETKEAIQENQVPIGNDNDNSKTEKNTEDKEKVEESQEQAKEPSKARKILGATGSLLATPFKMVGAFGKTFFKSEFLKEKGMIPGAGIAFALVEATFAMLLTGVPALFKGIAGLFSAIFSRSKSQGKNLNPEAQKDLIEINKNSENLQDLGKKTLEYGIEKDLEKGGKLQEKVAKNKNINEFAKQATGKDVNQLYAEKKKELENKKPEVTEPQNNGPEVTEPQNNELQNNEPQNNELQNNEPQINESNNPNVINNQNPVNTEEVIQNDNPINNNPSEAENERQTEEQPVQEVNNEANLAGNNNNSNNDGNVNTEESLENKLEVKEEPIANSENQNPADNSSENKEEKQKDENEIAVENNEQSSQNASGSNESKEESKEEEVELPDESELQSNEPSKARKIVGATGNLLATPFVIAGAFGKTFFKSKFLKEKGMIPGAGVAFALVEASIAALVTGVPAVFNGFKGLFKAIFASAKANGININSKTEKDLIEINEKSKNLNDLAKNTLEYGLEKDLQTGSKLKDEVIKDDNINEFSKNETGKSLKEAYADKEKELENSQEELQNEGENIESNADELTAQEQQRNTDEMMRNNPQYSMYTNDPERDPNQEQNVNEEEQIEENDLNNEEFIIETNEAANEENIQDYSNKDDIEKDEKQEIESIYSSENGINDLEDEEYDIGQLDEEDKTKEESLKETEEPRKESAFDPIREQMVGKYALDKMAKNEDITKGGISKFEANEIKNANENIVDGSDTRNKREANKDMRSISGNYKLAENLDINSKDLNTLKENSINQMKDIASSCDKIDKNSIDKLVDKNFNNASLKDSSFLKNAGLNKDKIAEMEKEANNKGTLEVEKEELSKKEESKSIDVQEKSKDEQTKSKELSNDEKNINNPIKEKKEEIKENSLNELSSIPISGGESELKDKEEKLEKSDRQHIVLEDYNFPIEYDEESFKDAPKEYSNEKQLTNELSQNEEELSDEYSINN